MGWIAGFVGGASDAVAEIGKMELIKKAERERDDALAERQRTLSEYEQGRADARAGREHGWRMDEAGFEAKKNAEQKDLDREIEREKIAAEERVSRMRGSRTNKPVRIGEDADGNAIYGIYNPETDEIEPIDIAGREGGSDQNAELSAAELDRARVELNTAGGKDRANDWMPFNEPSDDLVKARAYENRKGSKVDGKADTRRATEAPAVENPATGKPTPNQRQIQALRDNPDKADQFDALFGNGASRRYLTEKAAPGKQEPPKKSSEAKTEKTPQQRIAEIEAKLKADDDLKAPGTGGILGRAMKARLLPLGMAERRTLERELQRLKGQ